MPSATLGDEIESDGSGSSSVIVPVPVPVPTVACPLVLALNCKTTVSSTSSISSPLTVIEIVLLVSPRLNDTKSWLDRLKSVPAVAVLRLSTWA